MLQVLRAQVPGEAPGTLRDVPEAVTFEADLLELGSRVACWLAAAANDPEFMLAGLRLRESRLTSTPPSGKLSS